MKIKKSLPYLFSLLLIICIPVFATPPSSHMSPNYPPIKKFIDHMAQAHNFSRTELTKLFRSSCIQTEVLDKLSHPAEKWPWDKYHQLLVSPEKVENGLKFWQENYRDLHQAAEIYQVPPEIIVAIIGIESNYGRNLGSYPVFATLASIAFYYPKRAKFFTAELEEFLLLSKEEKFDPLSIYGSYAGAIGNPQFMASSYRKYAVDFSHNGKRDLVNNNADSIGSVANYFNKHGWQPNQPLVLSIKLDPKNTDLDAITEKSLSIAKLKELGIYAGKKLGRTQKARVIKLSENDSDKFWLALDNFFVITRYNANIKYAMAVYSLSKELRKRYASKNQATRYARNVRSEKYIPKS